MEPPDNTLDGFMAALMASLCQRMNWRAVWVSCVASCMPASWRRAISVAACCVACVSM